MRDRAADLVGCQSANSPARIGITGAPRTVTDDKGTERRAQRHRGKNDGRSGVRFDTGGHVQTADGHGKDPAVSNKVLAAAGFRCNVQEQVGVSRPAKRPTTDSTFAADKFSWRVTDAVGQRLSCIRSACMSSSDTPSSPRTHIQTKTNDRSRTARRNMGHAPRRFVVPGTLR